MSIPCLDRFSELMPWERDDYSVEIHPYDLGYVEDMGDEDREREAEFIADSWDGVYDEW
ncbi:MAG: hypothetical protein AAGU32_22460 [Bacillota bacterium]